MLWRLQRANQRFDFIAAFVEDRSPHREHLLDPAAPDLGGRQRDMPDAAIDGDRVPWFADADAVDFAGGKRVGGEGRAGDDDFDILIGTNADTREPVAQHVIVA